MTNGSGFEATDGRPPIVVLVEDDFLLRSLLSEELTNAGWEVIEFALGDRAWPYMQAGNHVDIVISDISMPGLIQGDELYRLVRSAFPSLVVILTSAYPAVAKGPLAPHFLQKPFDTAELVALVNRLTAHT